MQHDSVSYTDQESVREQLQDLLLGQDYSTTTASTYYVFIEGSSFMLLNGPSSTEEKKIGAIVLPSALQIAYLVNTAESDRERRQAAREGISKMYGFLTESVEALNRIDSKEAKKVVGARSAWIADTPMTDYDTKTCDCRQYQLTGDCLCDETCSALNGCRMCML